MKVEQYPLYNGNLEFGFVYDSSQEERVKKFNSKIVEAGNEQRELIKNVYTGNNIQSAIKVLEQDSTNPNAFWHTKEYGWISLGVILSDQDDSVINPYITNYEPSFYSFVPVKKDMTDAEILKKIYQKLGINTTTKPTITVNSTTNNVVTTGELEIKSTTILNIGATVLDMSNISGNTGHIKGTVKLKDASGNETPVGMGDVKVKLKKNGNNFREIQTNENGMYAFAYPGTGNYTLEFEVLNKEKYNGQYYEFTGNGRRDIDETTSAGCNVNNCISDTNIVDVIANSPDTINYEIEEKLDYTISSVVSKPILGNSNTFYIAGVRGGDEDGDGEPDFKSIEHPITQADAILIEREKFSLTVKQDVNQYKIVLSNGQVFKQYNFDPNSDYHKIRLFNITMDTKLSYGAKLFVEYKITVYNNSNIDCNSYTILSRFENLEYDKEHYLLSNSSEKNSRSAWSVLKSSDVKDLIGVEDNTNSFTYLKFEDTGGLAKMTGGVPGTKEFFVTLTRPLDAEDGSTIFNGSTELINYRNPKRRRNYSNITLTGNGTDNVIRAGNFANSGHLKEDDIGISEDIAILPPTGFDLKTFIFLIGSTLICFIAFKYIMTNKVYVMSKKKKIRKKWNKE